MFDAALPPGWQAVLSLQQYLENKTHLDAAALGFEEAFTNALDVFASGEPVSDEDFGRKFYSRRKNRIRRNRHREKLTAAHARTYIRPVQEQLISDASVEAAEHEVLRLIAHKLDAGSFSLLMRVADGAVYAELAVEFGVLETAVRTKVCRVREKARAIAA